MFIYIIVLTFCTPRTPQGSELACLATVQNQFKTSNECRTAVKELGGGTCVKTYVLDPKIEKMIRENTGKK